MLKKITIYDPDTMGLSEIVINTVLIHSVNKHPKKDDTLIVHYNSRMFQVKEPLQAFIERINTGMDHEVFNRFKAVEAQILELTNGFNGLEHNTTEAMKGALEDIVDQVNQALAVIQTQIPKQKKELAKKQKSTKVKPQ